jgi:hypothetical protein
VYLGEPIAHIRKTVVRVVLLSVALLGLCLSVIGTTMSPLVGAAGPVTYSITPISGSVQPNNIVDITLSFTTEVAIAGASVNLAYTNGSYDGFESSGSPGLSFIDYHTGPNDLVFICNNNNCPPGTYQVAKISAKAAQSGTMGVAFTPKETIDTQLNEVGGYGTSGSYNITQSAPASTTTRRSTRNTFTIPQDDGNGGTEPLQITDEDLGTQLRQAEQVNEQIASSSKTSDSFWTPRNLIFVGVGIGFGFAVFFFALFKFFIRPPDPPISPPGSSGLVPPPDSGTMIYPGQ